MATKNNLIRRLRREVTASPKKAAVLGISLVIAIWFWAPLVGKWVGTKSGDETAIAPANDQEMATNTTTPAVTVANTAPTKWRQVLEWMRNDPLMQPYTPQMDERDPFAPSASQIAKRDESQPPVPIVPELTPQQAGLELRSTVVGARTKTAMISGRAYHENQSILASNGRDRFLLVKIRPDSVLLERHGKSFEVKLPRVEATSTED